MATEDVLPTLVLLAIVYGLYKWLSSPTRPTDALRGVRRDMVDAVHSAFPDQSIEAIVYSLSRTRSAQATSEIILERGRLPTPPAGFTVPDTLRPVPVPVPAPGSVVGKPTKPPKPVSLVERYGLSARAAAQSAEVSDPEAESVPARSGASTPASLASGSSASSAKWEADRAARESDLKARKERMILEARKRMLAKRRTASATTAEGDKTEAQ